MFVIEFKELHFLGTAYTVQLFINFPMSGINTVITDHLIMLFRDVLKLERQGAVKKRGLKNPGLHSPFFCFFVPGFLRIIKQNMRITGFIKAGT